MARTDVFTGLAEFLAVAQRASFRAAGADLGVTPPLSAKPYERWKRASACRFFNGRRGRSH
jgi:hypothetical protein